MDISLTDTVLLIAALAIVYVISKLNSAIQLLNNRVNILSHALKQIRRDLEEASKIKYDSTFMEKEAALRARLDKDFK